MIVFSDGQIVEELFDGSNKTTCVEELADILAAAGWNNLGAITGGYKFELTSRQGLQARCTLVASDFGAGEHGAALTMMSADESAVGATFRLKCAPDQTFKAIANECQLFAWLPGYSDDAFNTNYNHNYACGIPFVFPSELEEEPTAGECGIIDNAEIVTRDLWWACGGSGTAFQPATFRWSLTTSKFTSTASWNYGVIGGTGAAQSVRIFPTRHARSTLGVSVDYTRWANGDPIYLDPLIGWGDAAGNPAKFRGQIYDAFLASYDQPLEDTLTTGEPNEEGGLTSVNWLNYTHSNLMSGASTNEYGSYNGSLYLRRPGLRSLNNIAY